MYQNSTYESNPISLISYCHNANPLFLSRGSENLCEGRCFKRLIIQVTISHTPSVHLCLEACAISCWSGQIQQLIPVLSFIILSPLPYPASWSKEEKKRREWKGKEKRRKEKHPCILKDQRALIGSHSWGCYGDGQFWPSGCRSHWCWGKHWVAELWTHRFRKSTRGPPPLRKWLACSAHSPYSRKAFLMESQPLHIQMEHYLALLTALSILWGSGGVLFPSCS